MTTDNRSNELTPEQILVDEWARQADRAKSMTGMDAIWFPDAEETLAVLRANGLLSEGTPSEAQVERAARALFEDPHMSADYTWAELVEDDPTRAEIWRIDARRTLTAAAGVAPQPVIDEAALAEVIADAPHSGDPNVSCLDPRCKAAAVAAWLRGGVAPQEPSRLPDFFVPKPMPNSYVPAPGLPSSICQHNMVRYTDSVSEKPENFCSLCGYQPSSGVDEETLANLIHSTSVAHFGGLDPRVAPIIARAVAEFLKGQGR